MTCCRSAMLMLIACILLGAPSRGSQTATLSADPILSRGRRPRRSASSISGPLSARPSRGATLSQFTPVEDPDQERSRRDLPEDHRRARLRPRHLARSALRFGDGRTGVLPLSRTATSALLIRSNSLLATRDVATQSFASVPWLRGLHHGPMNGRARQFRGGPMRVANQGSVRSRDPAAARLPMCMALRAVAACSAAVPNSIATIERRAVSTPGVDCARRRSRSHSRTRMLNASERVADPSRSVRSLAGAAARSMLPLSAADPLNSRLHMIFACSNPN